MWRLPRIDHISRVRVEGAPETVRSHDVVGIPVVIPVGEHGGCA
jgi:hypothetical protein